MSHSKPLALADVAPFTAPSGVEAGARVNHGTVYTVLRAEARDLWFREPLMRDQLTSQILERDSPYEVVIDVVAWRLAAAGQPASKWTALFYEALLPDMGEFEVSCAADLAAVRTRDPSCPSYLHILLNSKGFQTLVTYRAARQLWLANRREIALWLSNTASLVFGADIHPGAQLGRGLMFDHATGVVIGETAIVEDGVSLLQNVTLGGTGKERGARHPKVRRGVMIGAGANVLGNIEVGAMSKVAAGSVVLESVPPNCTVAGVPAKVVRRLSGNECPAEEMNQNI